jgi:hypothetical protein
LGRAASHHVVVEKSHEGLQKKRRASGFLSGAETKDAMLAELDGQ